MRPTPTPSTVPSGRLFSTTLDFRENMREAVKVFDDRGDLEGKTIGVFTTNETTESELIYQEGLKPALEEAGYEVAEEVVLPCPPGSCEQTEAGVQRMVDAGVDAVFTTINMVSFTSVVSAGAEVGLRASVLRHVGRQRRGRRPGPAHGRGRRRVRGRPAGDHGTA